ncbi:MAG: hypothetical protein OZ921_01730 [Sorangiineae bacterium]|nr:hypothetical protein [Polyangiaceae bacterium]MEB2321203.1 hypothetical protein [Sorangiineae bacterium]
MSETGLPDCVARLLWDMDVERLDLDRARKLIMERVMSRGGWEAMKWLRARSSREELAEYLLRRGALRLSPRDLAYWALVCDLNVEVGPGGGRPPWAGP